MSTNIKYVIIVQTFEQSRKQSLDCIITWRKCIPPLHPPLSHFLSYRLQILHGSSYGQYEQILKSFEKQNGCQKIKWLPNRKIEHNSFISWATESIFCMEVCMDSPNFILKSFEKQNGRQIGKLSITRSFLELHSPDFAWKFWWTV